MNAVYRADVSTLIHVLYGMYTRIKKWTAVEVINGWKLSICMVLRHKGKFLTVATNPVIEDGTELRRLLEV
jgi:hypothetical protein